MMAAKKTTTKKASVPAPKKAKTKPTTHSRAAMPKKPAKAKAPAAKKAAPKVSKSTKSKKQAESIFEPTHAYVKNLIGKVEDMKLLKKLEKILEEVEKKLVKKI